MKAVGFLLSAISTITRVNLQIFHPLSFLRWLLKALPKIDQSWKTKNWTETGDPFHEHVALWDMGGEAKRSHSFMVAFFHATEGKDKVERGGFPLYLFVLLSKISFLPSPHNLKVS